MASGGIDDNVELSPGQYDDEPESDTYGARFMASGGFGSSGELSGDFDDSYSDTDEAGIATLVGAAELFDSRPETSNLGTPEYHEKAYIRFYYDKVFEFSKNVGYGLNNVNWMREFVKETSTYPIMSEFCIAALSHLCSNYATEEQKAKLKDKNYDIGTMFDVVETLLKECQIDLSEQCDDCKKSKLVKSSSHELPRPKEGDLLPLFVKKRLPHQVPQERSTTTPKRTVTSTPKNIFGRIGAKMKGAFSKNRETMRISPFQEEYLEQLLDDSLLIDETPPRQNSRSFSLPRIEITPPSPTDPRTRIRNSSSPTVITSPPRTPFISKSRFGFTDPTVPPGELNIPPGPFELPTPYRRTIALSSPKREEPVFVNIAVDPKPLIDTERGERFVCDISIDVQPGQSDLRKQLPYASGLSSPHLHDTSADTSRGRTSEMSVSPVIKRGRMGQYHATPVSSGLFTPRIYKRPRRKRIPGSHPISELPWSPTYLPEDARSPVSGVTSPPYLSDESISWERSADSYYGSSPDISPVTERPTYEYRSPDFWNHSASPVIKRPTYGYPSTSPSPSPVIKRPSYGYRSPDFWSRPIYGYQSPYSDRSSQSRDRSLSPDRSKTSDSRFSPDRTNTESELYFQKGPPYDPSIVNEARILDENYFSPGRRTPRTNMESERHVLEGSIYDPSVVNEACFLDDRCSSRNRTDKETERHFQRRSPYDPSTVNEANFLDDRYFSPGRRNTRSPYDPSIVNEANILDDRHSSSGRRTPRSPYDPSIVNEANFLDDRHSSPDRRTIRLPYDPSIVNEANCLDDRYSSPDRRTPRSPYDPSMVNEATILDDNDSSADRTNLELERDFLEGSLYDSSIVNEGRFLD